MPKSEIGVWTLYFSVATVLELMRNGFIRNPMISHFVAAESEHERNSVVTASLALHCIVVAIVSILLLFGAKPLSVFWDAPQLDTLFYVYILRGIALIPCYHFEFIQQSQSNFKAIFFGNAVRLGPLALYTMVVYFLGMHPTLLELAIVQLISTIASAFVEYQYVKNIPLFYKSTDFKLVKSLFSFGKYTLGTSISSMIIRSTDSWMIGRMISTVGVALYNPALRISNLVEVPTLAVANLVYPQVNQKMKERGNEGIQDVYIKSVSLILAAMLPMVVPLFLLSDFVIEIIFGEGYLEASPILRVTIFFMLIIPFNRQFGTVLDALKRPKLNFYLLVLMGVLNIIFNYFLLLKMGPIGAAYGTLLSYIIIFIINQIILYRWFGINTFKVFTGVIEWYKMGWQFFWLQVSKISR